jgi:DNA polymerase sigma
MPYLEGGELELGPPKKEPKKTLDPDESGKLSQDMRELYDRLLPSEQSEQRRAELIVKLNKIMQDEWPDKDIKVAVFGSSGNLLSSSDSDVDICVTTSDKQLATMHSLAMLLHRSKSGLVVTPIQ